MAAASMADSLAPTPSPSSTSTDCSYDDVVRIYLIRVLVVLAISSLSLLHILGSLRRQSSHGLLHNLVSGVDTLSYPLVSYTVGAMNSSYCYVNDYAVWAVSMLLLLGSTGNLTACRLDDVNNWKSIYVKHIFKGVLVVSIVVGIITVPRNNHRHFPYIAPVVMFLLVGILKGYVRIASMRMVSKSFLSKNMKVIGAYMEHKDNLRPPPFDPVTMEGYSYLVAGEKYCKNRPGSPPWYNDDALERKVITVEQIWRQCRGNMLLHERGNLLKDLCLSMTLSKMLNRRFAGFNMSEAGHPKTHDLVFNGLLGPGVNAHHRAFRIIEQELVFVHDIYYTSYSYLYQKGRYMVLCLPVIMCGVCLWLTCLIIKHHSDPDYLLGYTTVIITVVLVILEGYQLYLYIASGWFKVALIGTYVTTPFLQRSGCSLITGLLLRFKAFRPWEEKLGQYCFLEEICKKNRCRVCLHYATLRLVEKTSKKGRKKSVRLPENVKMAVIASLIRSDGHLTNGVRSLQTYFVDGHLPAWACYATATEGWVTRKILVWHIATTLCKHRLDGQPNGQDYQINVDTVTTATTLSEYCMHLLAFSPNLLPDHSSISEYILDKVIEETGNILRRQYGRENLCDCDKLLAAYTTTTPNLDEARLVVHKGIQLATHLIDDIVDPIQRWTVLSDFWAEMMLYVSPSDNARAHLEALARGGEFITHLWALLTHAGILKREPTGP